MSAPKLTKLELNPGFLEALSHFASVAGDFGFWEKPHLFVTLNENARQVPWTIEDVLHLAHSVLTEEPVARYQLKQLRAILGDAQVDGILATPERYWKRPL